MQRAFGTLTIAGIFALWAGVLLAATYVGATPLRDSLCRGIADPFGFACAATRPLAASALKPGDLIDQHGERTGALDSLACRIPGATPLPYVITDKALTSEPRRVSYSALGAMARDNLINGPWPAGQALPASRAWNALRRVDVAVSTLHRADIDQAAALHSLASCSIRTRCVDELRAGKIRLVSSTLIADNVQYQLKDARNARRDDLAQRLARDGIAIFSPSSLRATNPLVIGTQSIAPHEVTALATCDKPVALEASGTTEAAIAGHGGRGAFGDQYIKQPLGTVAQVFAQGSEVSDCDPDLGREKSRGYAQAALELTHGGGLHLSGEIRATSGRYRFGRCNNGRRLPSNNTLANTAMARVRITGALDILVRYEQAVNIELRWTGVPAGTLLRVVAPDGQALIANQAIEGDGDQRLKVVGPGVFHVLPTINARLDRTGQSGVKSAFFNATLDAVVKPVAAANAG